MKFKIQILPVFIIFICFLNSSLNSGTIHVPGDHYYIQDALNAASEGDIIEVYSGKYIADSSKNKEINIEKDNIILRGLDQELGSGEDTGMPLIEVIRNDGMHDFGIEVTSNNVEICGLDIFPDLENMLFLLFKNYFVFFLQVFGNK